MKLRFAAVAALATLALHAPAASAEETAQLKFATVSPAQGPLNMRLLHPWAARVNAHREPSATLDVRDGYALANFGNLYDRIRFGYVIDFLEFYYRNYHWPSFNVADAAISAGVVLLGIEILRNETQSRA